MTRILSANSNRRASIFSTKSSVNDVSWSDNICRLIKLWHVTQTLKVQRSSQIGIFSSWPVMVDLLSAYYSFWPVAKSGIWDVLSNQEVVDFVTQRIGQAMEPEDICEELMTRWVVLDLVDSGREKKRWRGNPENDIWQFSQVPFTRLPDGWARLW